VWEVALLEGEDISIDGIAEKTVGVRGQLCVVQMVHSVNRRNNSHPKAMLVNPSHCGI
jgi:hypothetical protein